MSFDLVQFVKQQEPFFINAVSDQSVQWAKESQFAIQLLQRNDILAKTAISNPTSAQNAIINVAAIGISLNPASKLAYMVPRDGMVCLDISYMGLLHIAQAAGVIKWGQCKLVYASDTYEPQGLDRAPLHKYNAFASEAERGAVVGGYCTVKTADGDYLTEEMSLAEIKATEATSKAKNGPWKNFWNEMARKTIVKRASKYWPRAERMDRANDVLNEYEGIHTEPVMPYVTEEKLVQDEHQRDEEFSHQIGELCDRMGMAESMNELKEVFKQAYRLTAGNPLQRNVQEVYATEKARLEAIV